jgi:cell division protein FtsX
VAVVNRDFGRYFYHDPNPVGRHFKSNGETYTIVGVVGNVVKQLGMSAGPPLSVEPMFYVAAAQTPQALVNLADEWFQPSWVVRTQGPAPGMAGKMERALAKAAPGLPFSGVGSMQAVLDQQIQVQRIEVTLLGTLAWLALLLSAVGIYALVANLVAQRTREIGIRIALGATLGRAMREMASPGMLAAGGGVAAGLAGSFFALRLLRGSIYGVGVYDPVTMTLVPLLLLAIAGAASLLPARRVAVIDPAETLRNE